MKKLLIGLLALGSISALAAQDAKIRCFVEQKTYDNEDVLVMDKVIYEKS